MITAKHKCTVPEAVDLSEADCVSFCVSTGPGCLVGFLSFLSGLLSSSAAFFPGLLAPSTFCPLLVSLNFLASLSGLSVCCLVAIVVSFWVSVVFKNGNLGVYEFTIERE